MALPGANELIMLWLKVHQTRNCQIQSNFVRIQLWFLNMTSPWWSLLVLLSWHPICKARNWKLKWNNICCAVQGLNGLTLWPSDAIWRREIWVNIGSGNGLLPDSAKPSPEPKLTDHQWSPMTFISGQFHERCLNHQSLKSVWKLHF